jgi:hypothetical protein
MKVMLIWWRVQAKDRVEQRSKENSAMSLDFKGEFRAVQCRLERFRTAEPRSELL